MFYCTAWFAEVVSVLKPFSCASTDAESCSKLAVAVPLDLISPAGLVSTTGAGAGCCVSAVFAVGADTVTGADFFIISKIPTMIIIRITMIPIVFFDDVFSINILTICAHKSTVTSILHFAKNGRIAPWIHS